MDTLMLTLDKLMASPTSQAVDKSWKELSDASQSRVRPAWLQTRLPSVQSQLCLSASDALEAMQ